MPNDGFNVACSNTDEYETPPWLFKALDTEFGFDYDAAANEKNTLCARWTDDITINSVLLSDAQHVFCNPPYSNIDPFIVRAADSPIWQTWTLLLPVRGGTDWFATLRSLEKAGRCEIRFLRKRIRFLINGREPLNPKTSKPSGPRFDSLIAVVR